MPEKENKADKANSSSHRGTEQNQNPTLEDPGAAVAGYGRSEDIRGAQPDAQDANRAQEAEGNKEDTLGIP